jgi:hypothetical protein
MYNHSEVDFIRQDKATKVRPAAPLAIRFDGELQLFPEYDVGTDSENVGSVIINPDAQPPVQEGTVTTFGNWRTRRTSAGRRRTIISTRNVTTVTTTVDETLESFGERVVDVTVTPFVREQAIRFRATGLRPNEQHSLFFNGVNVDEHVEPARWSIQPVQ